MGKRSKYIYIYYVYIEALIFLPIGLHCGAKRDCRKIACLDKAWKMLFSFASYNLGASSQNGKKEKKREKKERSHM